MEPINGLARYASGVLEIAGVGAILAGALLTLLTAAVRLHQRADLQRTFRLCRGRMGGGILIGLEFLVAGDIIKTVAIEPDFAGVSVLAVIVLIRTFLSLALEVEVNGRWPWQSPPEQ